MPKQEVPAWFLFSSVVLQCIVVFPLLVSHFDYCTFLEQCLTCNTETNKFIVSIICVCPVLPTDTKQNVELKSMLK